MTFGESIQRNKDISIGFMAGSLYAQYSTGVWKGVIAATQEHGVGLFCFAGGSFDDPYGDLRQRNAVYELVRSPRIQGIIVLSASVSNFIGKTAFGDYLQTLAGLPLVSIGIPYDGIPSVTVDNTQGMRESLVHLIHAHGAKRIAFIRGPEKNPEAEQRYKAFCEVLKEYNIEPDPSLIVPGDFTKNTGVEAVSMLLDERKVKFDAIMCANDTMAIHAMNALIERGVRVPEDVKMIGFDDIDDCSFVTPPLTTVQQPLARLGYEAVKELIALIGGEKNPGKIVLPTRLVVRRSCGCVGKPTALLSFDRDTRTKTGQDTDVAEATLISTLTSEMEMRFVCFHDAIALFNWSKRIVQTLLENIRSRGEMTILGILEKTIIEGTTKSIEPIRWQSVISSLFKELHGLFPDDVISIDYIWKQALAIIGEVDHRTNSYLRYCTERESQELCLLSQDLSTAFRINSLQDVLSGKLGELGIESHYISFYDDPKRTQSYLVSASSRGRHIADDCNSRFPSSSLCPDSIQLKRSRNGYIVLPLYFKELQLGFITFEVGPVNGLMYMTLAIQISSALKSAELLRRVERQADSLQAEVTERISELHRANKKLIEEINERKKIEQLLSHEKERALITLESIADAVITTNTQGVITYLNPIAEKLTGWTISEAKGLPLKKVLNVIYSTNPKDKDSENPTEIALGQNRSIKLSGTIVLKSRDGGAYSIQESIAPIRDYEGRTIGAVIVIHNVSETQKMTREIIYHSSHDNLTGLLNRSKFEEVIKAHIDTSQHENREHTICLIDIDKFRVINDSFGSIAGDELLRHVGSILKSGMRTSDMLARLSGDQFGVLFPSCPVQRATLIAEDLCKLVNRSTFQWEGRSHKIEVSIGLVPIGNHTEDSARLLSAANTACIFAKRKGGNRVLEYRPDDAELTQYNNEIFFLSDISKALEEDRFCLYSQVIRPIGSTVSKGEHYEILIRMIDENGGIVSPETFITPAERYNIMPTIDRWAIHRLFSTYRIDYNETLQYSLAKYSINLSGASLNDEKFLDFIFEQFDEYGVPPFTVCFEITETAAISNFSRVVSFIKELKRIGCCFSLDDFGTGWASFNYLKHLPVDYLKIDGSFVRGMVDNPLDFVLVQTINHIGHVMGLETIAEYVEDETILAKLGEIGVNYAQGFAIDRPKPLVM